MASIYPPHRFDAFPRSTVASGGELSDRHDSTSVGLIESGMVVAMASARGTDRICIGVLGPGSLVGADAADATPDCIHYAISPATTVAIPRAALRAAEHDPNVASRLRLQMAHRNAQLATIAVCNAQHDLAQKCARWLLYFAQALGEVVPITHAFLAEMLGVRRAGVTETFIELQRQGIVQQRRGRIVILDEPRLRERSCACRIPDPDPAGWVSADMLRSDPGVAGGERQWIEQEILLQSHDIAGSDATWRRREAVLRVCRGMLEREGLMERVP